VSGEAWSQEKPPCRRGAQAITAALTQPQPNTTVCTVAGKISADTSLVLREVLAQACRGDNTHLVIDLSTVTSMDATGLYVLFETLSKHNLGGGRLAVVVNPQSRAIHELHIVALQAAFDLHHHLAGALRACANTDTDT
jgi:anti-anti-sigma factor